MSNDRMFYHEEAASEFSLLAKSKVYTYQGQCNCFKKEISYYNFSTIQQIKTFHHIPAQINIHHHVIKMSDEFSSDDF